MKRQAKHQQRVDQLIVLFGSSRIPFSVISTTTSLTRPIRSGLRWYRPTVSGLALATWPTWKAFAVETCSRRARADYSLPAADAANATRRYRHPRSSGTVFFFFFFLRSEWRTCRSSEHTGWILCFFSLNDVGERYTHCILFYTLKKFKPERVRGRVSNASSDSDMLLWRIRVLGSCCLERVSSFYGDVEGNNLLCEQKIY